MQTGFLLLLQLLKILLGVAPYLRGRARLDAFCHLLPLPAVLIQRLKEQFVLFPGPTAIDGLARVQGRGLPRRLHQHVSKRLGVVKACFVVMLTDSCSSIVRARVWDALRNYPVAR